MKTGEMGGSVTLLGAYVEAFEFEETSWFIGRVWFEGTATENDCKTIYSTLIKDVYDPMCDLLAAESR